MSDVIKQSQTVNHEIALVTKYDRNSLKGDERGVVANGLVGVARECLLG